MSGQKKNYRMTYLGQFDVHVEVDRTVLTDEILRKYVDSESQIIEYGSPLKAFLTLLCCQIMYRSVLDFDVMTNFNLGIVEGFPRLDGTQGITLINYEDFEFNHEVDIVEETDDASASPQH